MILTVCIETKGDLPGSGKLGCGDRVGTMRNENRIRELKLYSKGSTVLGSFSTRLALAGER